MFPMKFQTSYRQTVTELVHDIVIALVDIPERVSVEASSVAVGTLIRIQVDPSDIGKVIGKQGRTARSLRVLLSAASMKASHRFSLDIEEGKVERH